MKKFPQFTEEHDIFRKAVRDFCARELAPNADKWEAERGFPREVFTKMAELGFLGCRYPEELGGSGGSIWHTAVLAEELPHANMAGLTTSVLVHTDMATPIIQQLGTQAQKEQFLMPAIRGEKIAALAI